MYPILTDFCVGCQWMEPKMCVSTSKSIATHANLFFSRILKVTQYYKVAIYQNCCHSYYRETALWRWLHIKVTALLENLENLWSCPQTGSY